MFLRIGNIWTKLVEKFKTRTFSSVTIFPKFVPFMRQCGKYGRGRQATNGNIMRRMHLACWMTKATEEHSE